MGLHIVARVILRWRCHFILLYIVFLITIDAHCVNMNDMARFEKGRGPRSLFLTDRQCVGKEERDKSLATRCDSRECNH